MYRYVIKHITRFRFLEVLKHDSSSQSTHTRILIEPIDQCGRLRKQTLIRIRDEFMIRICREENSCPGTSTRGRWPVPVQPQSTRPADVYGMVLDIWLGTYIQMHIKHTHTPYTIQIRHAHTDTIHMHIHMHNANTRTNAHTYTHTSCAYTYTCIYTTSQATTVRLREGDFPKFLL